MNSRKVITPPRFAKIVLAWYCKPSLLEDLEGDLEECFSRNVQAKGVFRARVIYFLDVIKFFRPYTIRQSDFLNLLIHWIMLGSYIKTSGRSIMRNKLFSAINIVGLAISMSVGLLMISVLSDLYNYDKFNSNFPNIYRITSQYIYKPDPHFSVYASTSVKAGQELAEALGAKETVAILKRGLDADVKAANKTLLLNGLRSNESLFSVFTFPFVSGDRATALKDPYTAVLTESTAKKIFGDIDPLGKTIELTDKKEYTVTGVMRDVDKFSHLQFDYLVSLSSLIPTEEKNKGELSWQVMWNGYVYFLMPEHLTPADVQKILDRIAAKENRALNNVEILLSLQPMKNMAVGTQLNNSPGPVMESSVIWIMVILTGVVIVSACFNYTNLSVARSLRRSKEVGIRKVIGAKRNNVMSQFITEAVVISLLALILAFALFVALRPLFLSINGDLPEMLTLDLSPRVIGGFVLLAIIIGLCAGFFPALFFAKVNAVSALKDNSLRSNSKLNMRKVLIIAQYSLSLMLIGGTLMGYRQYNHFLHFDLGFSTHQILNISTRGINPEMLAKDLSEMPEVKGQSKSALVTSIGSYYGTQMKYQDARDSTVVYYNEIDENYLPLHGHKLIAGRNFSSPTTTGGDNEVIINENVMKRFKIGGNDPNRAIGEVVTIDRKPKTVVGVMKNFYYGSANNEGDNLVILRQVHEGTAYINAKIETTDLPATMAKIERAYKKYDDIHPFNAVFYDDQIQKSYGELSSMLKIIGFLAFLAICIASMGMLGMVVFTTETRVKEISIRKVLGATDGNLIYTLSRGFMLLLIISASIGMPAAYLLFNRVILTSRTNHAPIQTFDFVVIIVVVLGVALLMIGLQTLKAARANPAQVLKAE